jgi:hypothetical protein
MMLRTISMILLAGAFSDEPVGRNSPMQAPSFKTLNKIQLKTGKVRFGFVLRSSSDYLEVLDIQSNAEVRLSRSEVQFMSPENAEANAVRRMGLPLVLSWKVKQYAHKRVRAGKIAKLEGALVYVTLGKNSGLAAIPLK